ncbi:hypothetical protein L838_0972 [Mycobacterium avium MAV_120709_2344]|nr:hypothetical protein L838_0972 [Mycobacterium avium MAV_120709_2344]
MTCKKISHFVSADRFRGRRRSLLGSGMNYSSRITREDCQPWVISHPDLCGEVRRKPEPPSPTVCVDGPGAAAADFTFGSFNADVPACSVVTKFETFVPPVSPACVSSPAAVAASSVTLPLAPVTPAEQTAVRGSEAPGTPPAAADTRSAAATTENAAPASAGATFISTTRRYNHRRSSNASGKRCRR